jgi:3'-5' exoribonuclease
MGVQLVSEKIRAVPDFPPKLKLLLEHIILSHHGALEFGSPKVPLFPEALLFHHLDNLDSKFEAMRAAIERDRYPENEFTGWVSALERVVLKKERFLHPTVPPAPESVAQTAAKPPQTTEPPKPAARPAPTSVFGEKLQAVLQETDKGAT